MILHAKSYQQKKDTAYHVVHGTVCKNCKFYGRHLHDCGQVLSFEPTDEYGYCYKFKRRED